jgi:hypothetical protein
VAPILRCRGSAPAWGKPAARYIAPAMPDAMQLPADAEGAITRDPSGLYKFGRATEKQQWLLKGS